MNVTLLKTKIINWENVILLILIANSIILRILLCDVIIF